MKKSVVAGIMTAVMALTAVPANANSLTDITADRELINSGIDNSELQVKAEKHVGNTITTIFTGKLKDYDNGAWVNLDFSEIGFASIYNWDTAENEVIYLIPVTNITADGENISIKPNKVLYHKSINAETAKGISIEDACAATAIMVLSGENVPALVYQKHRKLGSWEKTAEYYEVNLSEFESNISGYKIEIPYDVYNEMKNSGMTDDECYDFAMCSRNVQMDIAVTWGAQKNGKTIDDLIKEETALKNAKLQAAADYISGKITETEYTEKMKELSPDMDIEDILSFAESERKGWMDFRKATSGITDEEIKAAADAGITDFFAACRLKDAAAISDITFADMVYQVKMGKDIASVIKRNMSAEKINDKISKGSTDAE